MADVERGTLSDSPSEEVPDFCVSLNFLQKLIAEVLGTFFVIFAGCTAVVVNLSKDRVITHPGVSITWGLVVMVMVYSVGHISGAHFNPAVTLAFASCRRFPLKQFSFWKIQHRIIAIWQIHYPWQMYLLEIGFAIPIKWSLKLAYSIFHFPFTRDGSKVPAYIVAQIIGATVASGVIRLLFGAKTLEYPGTIPAGSDMQSFVLEFIITFFLMFVISGVATDNRAIGELAGIAVGATIMLNVIFAGPISGASMNPARSLGPAFIYGRFTGLWVYIVAPIVGAIAGAWAYNTIRFTNKPLREITKSGSFLKSAGRR